MSIISSEPFFQSGDPVGRLGEQLAELGDRHLVTTLARMHHRRLKAATVACRTDSPHAARQIVARILLGRAILVATVVLAVAGCGSTSTASAPPAGDFSGTGTEVLAPLDVTDGATIDWTNQDGTFFLIREQGSRPVDPVQIVVSDAHEGSAYLSPGHYVLKVSITDPGSAWSLDLSDR